MKIDNKTEQLQIRVSREQKQAIAREAKRTGMSMSDWVLRKVLPAVRHRFCVLAEALSRAEQPGYVLAEMNEFLTGLNNQQLKTAIQSDPGFRLDAYYENYLAAMVEQACVIRKVEQPDWLRKIKPLPTPHFVTDLQSVRLHLLLNAPPVFRNRNIFIDSSIGARV